MKSRGRIVIVAADVRLPGEARGLDREAYIADLLARSGFDVELVTSSFQHWDKAQRDTSAPMYQQVPYRITFLHTSNYTKNITPKRIFNHAQFAHEVAQYLDERIYDLMFAKMPPNDQCRVCAEYARTRGIPLIVDVNDLWPEAMRMVMDVPGVSSLAFSPFRRDADYAYRHATAVIGTSDDYAQRALMSGGTPELLTVYVGNDVAAFDQEASSSAVEKPADEFWVTYAGTIGTSYDLETLVRASRLLKDAGVASDLRLMILGEGPEREKLMRLADALEVNATFPGYLPHADMVPYLIESDVLVNSFVRKAPQSIVSKVGDYLAAGKPMINTLATPEFCRKVESDGFGLNVEPENPIELAAAILELEENPAARKAMGKAARRIAEEQFDRPRAYQRIVELVRSLL